MNFGYVYLISTVITDAVGIGFLNKANGGSDVKSLAVGLVLVNIGLVLLGLAFKTIPMSVANAMFAGLATLSVALIGWLYFGEKYSIFQYVCMGFILMGVVGLNLTGVGK